MPSMITEPSASPFDFPQHDAFAPDIHIGLSTANEAALANDAFLANDVAERRGAPRVPYDVMFQAAFSPDESPLKFVNVWGHDVSPVGISFLSPARPQGEEVILQFGAGTRVLCRICHCREVEHDGRTVQLIGCEFLRS